MLARICLNGVFVRVCILLCLCSFSVALIVFGKGTKDRKGMNGKGEKGMSKSL